MQEWPQVKKQFWWAFGIVISAKLILDSTVEDIERSFSVNVKSHFYVCPDSEKANNWKFPDGPTVPPVDVGRERRTRCHDLFGGRENGICWIGAFSVSGDNFCLQHFVASVHTV